MHEILVLPLLTMVTCKETRAVITALHKNGFTTTYQFLMNFKDRGSVVKKASGHLRVQQAAGPSFKVDSGVGSSTSAELAQKWQQV